MTSSTAPPGSSRYYGQTRGAAENERVVLVGNPGSGKSTILNSLLGAVSFRSGISLGTGLTQHMSTVTARHTEYTDTPGLSDVQTRMAAAGEVSRALSDAHALKLVFVVTLEAGSVRPIDVTTVQLVTTALRAAKLEAAYPYALIINKVEPSVLDMVARDKKVVDQVLEPFRNVCQLRAEQVLFVPMEETAVGASDVLLHGAALVKPFIERLPVLETKNVQVTVDARNLEEVALHQQRELRKRLQQLTAAVPQPASSTTPAVVGSDGGNRPAGLVGSHRGGHVRSSGRNLLASSHKLGHSLGRNFITGRRHR